MRAVAALLLTAAVALPAAAFPPTNFWANQAGHRTVAHEAMTGAAIQVIDEALFGPLEPDDPPFVVTTPMKDAFRVIADANAEVDDDPISSAKHFDCENFDGGQVFLVRNRNIILGALADGDVETARRALGQSLHAVQDFYAHTNWVELGHRDPHPALGRRGARGRGFLAIDPVAAADEPTCEPGGGPEILASFLATGKLTSGYYGGEDIERPVLSSGVKCNHGGLRDSGAPHAENGIAKDTTNSLFAPRHYLHREAVGVAVDASVAFIKEVVDELTVSQARALLGAKGPALTFVFDTTGSMGEVLDRAKARAIDIVNRRVGTLDEPVSYLLVPYGDPNVSLIIVDTADEFIDVIDGLRPAGGGDCPELSMSATETAVSATPEGGAVFVFTDASAKDSSLSGAVASLAASKRVKVRYLLFGSCSPIDPAYYEVAAASGGQVFELDPSEAGEITRLADLVLRPSAVDVLAIGDELAGGPRAYAVPVDATMTRLAISVSGTADVTVRRPGGSEIADGDAGVELVPLSTGALAGVESPVPGTWTVELDGDGPVSLSVTGESVLALDGFRFVERRGRPGHEGWFPIPGFPPAGEPSMVTATLSETVPTVRFELLARDGSVLSTLALDHGPGQSEREFSGEVTLPDEPFVASVAGEDASGHPFRRVAASTVVAQPLVVTPPAEGRYLVAGDTAVQTFRVTNLGDEGEFEVLASDTGHYVSAVAPDRLSLDTGESAEVRVTLAVPAAAALPPSNTLTVTAGSSGDASVRNFAVVRSVVEQRDDGDACTVDTCDPRLGCLHRPLEGFPALDCELGRLLALGPCTPEWLGQQLGKAFVKKVTRARTLVTKAGGETRAKRIRRLLKRTDAMLRKSRGPVKRALRKELITASCGDLLLSEIASRREEAAALREAATTGSDSPMPGTTTTTTPLTPVDTTTTTTTRPGSSSSSSSSTTTTVTTTTTEITIIIEL